MQSEHPQPGQSAWGGLALWHLEVPEPAAPEAAAIHGMNCPLEGLCSLSAERRDTAMGVSL